MALLKVIVAALAATSFVASTSAYNVHLPRDVASVNPVGINLIPLDATINERRMTNAERMRRGLTPNRPDFHKRGHIRGGVSATPTPRTTDTPVPTPTDTPTETPEPTPTETPTETSEPTPTETPEPTPTEAPEPTPTPAPLCTGRSGVIRAHAGAASASDPWLSKHMNAFGEYGTTTSLSDALTVTLCGESGAFSIWGTNALISDLPFLGGISGAVNTNDNMSPSSYNYAYVGATVQTANGSPAVSGDNSFSRATGSSRKIESAIWSISSDDSLTTSWVNSNGARVNGVIVHVVSGTDDAFVFTAGYSGYVDMFGPSPIWNFSFEEL